MSTNSKNLPRNKEETDPCLSPDSKRRKTGPSGPPMEEISKLLECPICLEVMIGVEIYQCKKGHHLCKTCKSKVKNCPTCRSVVTTSRAFGLESMADTLSFNCKNSDCPITLKGSEMNAHLMVCEFRPFECFESEKNKCRNVLVNISEFENHLIFQHEAKKYGNSPTEMKLTIDHFKKGRWDISCIEYDGRIFLSNKEIKDKHLYMWLTMIGSEAEASRYFYKVTIPHPKYPQQSIKWSLPIHSHHLCTIPQADGTGDIVYLSTKQLATFCKNEDNKFKCDVIFEIYIPVMKTLPTSVNLVSTNSEDNSIKHKTLFVNERGEIFTKDPFALF